ncbi:MAG: GGDEF domain-containing protein [Actinomycetota bacterium]|nr:GGDEF domain-containing protein [Actinomycetota bacterium]
MLGRGPDLRAGCGSRCRLDPGTQASAASLWAVSGLLLAVELGSVLIKRPNAAAGLTSSMMFIFALLLHWGLAGVAMAIIVQTVMTIVAGFSNRKVLWRTVFNATQYAVCLGAAYLCLLAFGINGSMESPAPVEALTLPALFVAAVVSLLVNTILVGTSIALHSGTSWWHEVFVDIAPIVPINDGASIALAPLVVLATERSPWLIPLLLIPLFAVYRGNVASLALKHQAAHDALTGLANRAYLQERAEQAIAALPTRSTVGLFVIDLDRFKEINDTLGHPAGDRVLQVISDRLSGAVRSDDLVARLGGDEFAVLLPDRADELAARSLAARVIGAIREPIQFEAGSVQVDGSLGIALAVGPRTDFETLLQHADHAMYLAKHRGTSSELYSSDAAAAGSRASTTPRQKPLTPD